MRLVEYLDKIDKIDCIKLCNGCDKTIESFFHNCIQNTLPKKEVIYKWDKLLTQYVNEEGAIYFIRKYASASNNNWNDIRRGFYTKYNNNFGYVFCDNYFAHYFYIMAINEYVPEYKDFYNTIINRKFPYGFRETKEEIPYRAFNKGKNIRINSNGWKLAHIFPINGNDYNFDYKTDSKILFPRGNQDDWKHYTDTNYPYRKFDYNITLSDRNKMKAHFLRLVHPINYFLVPKISNEVDATNNNIGEFNKLLQYIYLYKRNMYNELFKLYETNILFNDSYGNININELKNIEINIKYGMNIQKSKAPKSDKQGKSEINKTKIESTKSINYSFNEIDLIKAYLKDGLSYRNIEIKIMGIDSPDHGGGFSAMNMLHNLGIEGENKGALKYKTIDNEIKNAKGKYKLTLIKYKNLL
jgi:hypothetical protein